MHDTDQLNASLAGRYVIDRLIGEGGMATVYLARDVRHNRSVALKVLKPDLGAVVGVDRFLAEIQVTANLQHPHLLPLFDSGAADGALFYVMPYIEGESLRAQLDRERQLPLEDAIRIATAVASALDYAHRHGVIHRDLKPENILMHEGQPLVADFGIALAVSKAGGNRITQTGLSLGTPQYMSPEQATGDRAIDARTDLYSLGALTYEMLTGEPPHVGSTSQAIIARVLTEKPRSIRASRPSVPEQVSVAVHRALEKLPADRWSSAKEFADALAGKSVVAPAPREPQAPSAESIGGASGRRARRRDPIVLALALLALGGLGVGAWQWIVAHREEPGIAVRIPLAFAAFEQVTDFFAATSSVAISADGRLVAYVGQAKTDPGGRMIFVHRLDEGDTKEVRGSSQPGNPFFSPDGRWIGFYSAGELKKVPVEGGTPTTLVRVPGTFWGATWTLTSDIVFASNGKLFVVPATGGTPRLFADADSADGLVARWPHVLADGKTVLYARGPVTSFASKSRVAVTAVDERSSTVLELPGTSPLGVLDGQLIFASATGALLSAPFDSRRRRITGTSAQVIEAVGFNATAGIAKASLSESGSLAYQPRATTSHPVLVAPGAAERTLIKEAKSYSNPRFSPDGKLIAVGVTSGASTDVWIYNLLAGTFSRLTSGGTVNGYPEWSPDGRRVIFRSDRELGSALWWQRTDGTGPAELLLRSVAGDIWEGLLSPDGRSLVYRLGSQGDADIWYRRLAGDTTPHSIASTPSNEWAPRISPDGRWVAYSSNESGAPQVYVRPLPGPGARVQASVETGETPVWSRDGHRLYWVYARRLLAATVTPGPAFAVSPPQTIFESDYLFGTRTHANYDVSPDGKQFLFLKPVGDEPQVMVIHDWKYELRAGRAARTIR